MSIAEEYKDLPPRFGRERGNFTEPESAVQGKSGLTLFHFFEKGKRMECEYKDEDGCCEHVRNTTPECHEGICPEKKTQAEIDRINADMGFADGRCTCGICGKTFSNAEWKDRHTWHSNPYCPKAVDLDSEEECICGLRAYDVHARCCPHCALPERSIA